MAALYTRPNIFTLGRAFTITLGRAFEARPKVSSEAAFKTRLKAKWVERRPIWGRPMAALYTRPNTFTLGRA